MRLMRYSIRWVCIVLSTFLVACSAVKIAYNNSDYLLLRYADSYLDLNSEQKEYLRLSLSERLQEHRRQELHQIVELLDSMKKSAADGLNAQEIDQLMTRIEPILETTVAKTVPVFTPVLTDLSDDQIAHLEKKMVEKNHEAKEEYLQEDHTERFEARTERITDRIERWTGSVSEDQQRLISSVIELWPETAQDWYDYRLLQQRKLLKILEDKANTEQIEPFILAWWVEQEGQSRDMKNRMKQLRVGIKSLLLALDASLSEQQRVRLTTRIDEIGGELAALAIPPIQLSYKQ